MESQCHQASLRVHYHRHTVPPPTISDYQVYEDGEEEEEEKEEEVLMILRYGGKQCLAVVVMMMLNMLAILQMSLTA